MRDLLSDNKGNFSTMRVMSLAALIVGIVYTFTNGGSDVLLIWLTAAFAPKAVQKFAER